MKHLLQRLITHILEKSSHDKIISNLLCEFLELHNSIVDPENWTRKKRKVR